MSDPNTDTLHGLPPGLLKQFVAARDGAMLNPRWSEITTSPVNVGNANVYGVLPNAIDGFNFTSGAGHVSLIGAGNDASVTMGATTRGHALTWEGNGGAFHIGDANAPGGHNNLWVIGGGNTLVAGAHSDVFMAGPNNTATLGDGALLHDSDFSENDTFLLGGNSKAFDAGTNTYMTFAGSGDATQYSGQNGTFDYRAAGQDQWTNVGGNGADISIAAGVSLDIWGWTKGALNGGGSWTQQSDGAGGTAVLYADGARVDFHGVVLDQHTHIG